MISREEREVLRGGIQFLFRHIRFDDSALNRMSGNEVFDLFDERRYHVGLKGKVDQVFLDSLYETSEVHVATFIMSIMEEGLFDVKSLVVAIIYLSRFKEVTRVLVHTYSWRLLFVVALLVADKANEDKPIRNKAMSLLFPVISPKELNELELLFCLKVRFTLIIKADLYNSFVRDKLMTERISRVMSDAIDIFIKQRIPETPIVMTTPQTIVKRSHKEHASSTRSRSNQPDKFRTSFADTSSLNGSRGLTPQDGRHSASLSRALSLSSFLGDSPPSASRRFCSPGIRDGNSAHAPKLAMKGFSVPRLCRDARDPSPSLKSATGYMNGRGCSPNPPRWNMY